MAEADIIVGHNLDNADVPWLKGDFYLPRIGHTHRPNLKPLPPFKTVDTFKVLRAAVQVRRPVQVASTLSSRSSASPARPTAYDRDAMERAVAGSVEDQQRLTDYCAGDVVATQWLYDWERPHIKNHPALFVDGQRGSTPAGRVATRRSPSPSGTSPTCSPTRCSGASSVAGTGGCQHRARAHVDRAGRLMRDIVVERDEQARMLYVRLSEGPIGCTVQLEGVNVDLSEDGDVVGVEVFREHPAVAGPRLRLVLLRGSRRQRRRPFLHHVQRAPTAPRPRDGRHRAESIALT